MYIRKKKNDPQKSFKEVGIPKLAPPTPAVFFQSQYHREQPLRRHRGFRYRRLRRCCSWLLPSVSSVCAQVPVGPAVHCPTVVQTVPEPHLISDQALAKRCPSSDQAPLISDQARPHTVLGVYVFV